MRFTIAASPRTAFHRRDQNAALATFRTISKRLKALRWVFVFNNVIRGARRSMRSAASPARTAHVIVSRSRIEPQRMLSVCRREEALGCVRLLRNVSVHPTSGEIFKQLLNRAEDYTHPRYHADGRRRNSTFDSRVNEWRPHRPRRIRVRRRTINNNRFRPTTAIGPEEHRSPKHGWKRIYVGRTLQRDNTSTVDDRLPPSCTHLKDDSTLD